MEIVKNNNYFDKSITVLYFAIALVEVLAEFYSSKLLLFIFKPLLSILLMVLYWKISTQRNVLFFGIIFFALITNVLFIPNTEKMLLMGLLTFLIHRILMIYYITRLINLQDLIPVFIGVIPFIFIFFYLLSISSGIAENSYYVLIIQNILISIIGGIVLSNYVMNDTIKNSWFLIYGLFSVVQYFIVFLEKYYLGNLAPLIFRPVAMILNVMVYYSFFRFVIVFERKNFKNSISAIQE